MEFAGTFAPVLDIVEDEGDGKVLGGGSGGGALADVLADPVVPLPVADREKGGVGTDELAALLAAEGEAVSLTECKDESFEVVESRQFMAGFMALDPAASAAGLLKEVGSISRSLARPILLSEAGLLMPIPGPLGLPLVGDEDPLPGIDIAPPPVGGIAPKPAGGVAPLLAEGIPPLPADGIPPLIPEPRVLLAEPIEADPCPPPIAEDWLSRVLPEPPASWLLGLLFEADPPRLVNPMLLSALPLP
ncbi:MAG TPA: hypothetical protein VH643_02410 [Gemmataceae bacterium]